MRYRRYNPEMSISDTAVREASRNVEKPLGPREAVIASDPFHDWRISRMMYHKDQYTYLGPYPTKARADKGKRRAHQILTKLAKVGMLRGTFGVHVIQHRKEGSVRPKGWYVEVENY